MQKKVVYLHLIISLFCVILSGCIEEKNSTNNSISPSNGSRILYVGKGNYSSIQDAIDAASDNDTIIVNNGTYYETVLIEKSIKIIAEEHKKTIITFAEGNHDQSDFIQIKAKGCRIEGFTIIGDYPISNASGISIFYSNNTVTQNSLYNTYHGIFIESGSENNIISYNNITNSRLGIYIFASYTDVFNNRLINNTYGIYLNDCYINNIFLNTITGNHWGIRLKGATNTQIFENQIQYNVEGVYSCCGAEQNTIFKNNFINNSENAYADLPSNWYKNTIGNYWSDYFIKYPNAQSQDTIWDIPYNISGGNNQDRYPLVKPFSI